jgi:DNA-binding response OmpR family regulator
MRQPQVVVYEGDGKLAALLQSLVEERNWLLREPRKPQACLSLLRQGGPTVLVLKVGRDLERDLTVLERTTWLRPQTATVVVGDTDHAALAGLGWDLGAAYVLMPPLPRELLPDLVAGLMGRMEDGLGTRTAAIE